LIDKQGILRYVHIGEGRYNETEQAIHTLLNEP
jgi:polyphosphate kinase